ncbi:Nascent polypeptide-associated complex subunit beta [Puccinia graminis f. sp. tritici]|uniref:Nascent polypeptide-associated complex subunit beta n=1 Tax=Puccinia graminis f. sp. tritici TaxID=56615 RepID=A0A5B0NE18_PUCGR|nr:Nascent polypeptide-associated complex subunit beta [Puccinia graminis f. sp. tritici]
MNNEKLKQLQAQTKVGSKGQPRRKVIKKPKGFTANGGPAGDDKKLQAALKKIERSADESEWKRSTCSKTKEARSYISPTLSSRRRQCKYVCDSWKRPGEGLDPSLSLESCTQLGAESIANLRRICHQANSMSYKPPNMAAGANNDDDDGTCFSRTVLMWMRVLHQLKPPHLNQ